MSPSHADPSVLHATALTTLYGLVRQARLARSVQELDFLVVNDSLTLQPYRLAALLLDGGSTCCLSGVISPEANAPYLHWLQAVSRSLETRLTPADTAMVFQATDLPEPLAQAWADWWPAYALALPLRQGGEGNLAGFLLFARDHPWSSPDQSNLAEWIGAWWHARQALAPRRALAWRKWLSTSSGAAGPWWRQRRFQALGAMGLVLALPVRLTVLVPGELVPAHPAVLRAPMEGVIERFEVQPNQLVQAGQALFRFDEALIQSKLQVAQHSLASAEAEYRQAFQQALTDSRAKQQLASLTSRIDERRSEVDYLEQMLTRAQVLAPQAGVVLLDDPSEWVGKPVAVGERILRIAAPHDVEVEAWVPMADALPVEPGADLKLYLHASPLSPITAQLRYLSHEAQGRPDGGYAYRLRATLTAPTAHRVGLKGSAKLYGGWVPLAYWMLRRPMAALRSWVGI